MTEDYAERLRETIAMKRKLRGVFRSALANEDNERQLRMAEERLAAAEAQERQ